MFKRRLTVLSMMLYLLLCPQLQAAEMSEAETMQTQLFGHRVGTEKAHACFRRTYDAVHLGRHPRQNVRTMMLLVTANPGGGPDALAASYQLVLDVSFRREGKHFETAGDCRSLFPASAGGTSTPAHCGIDCDGGSLDVSLKDAGTVMVGIPGGARIWQAGTDQDDDTGPYRKRFGADDKLFRLDRTSLADCLPLASDPVDKAALRHGR